MCIFSKFLFNPEQLVVFCQPLRSTRSTSLDLSSTQSYNKISNKSIFCFSTTMTDHHTPAIGLCKVASFNGLCNGSNLVDLQKKAVASFLLNCRLDPFWVSNCQIISNNLDVGL